MDAKHTSGGHLPQHESASVSLNSDVQPGVFAALERPIMSGPIGEDRKQGRGRKSQQAAPPASGPVSISGVPSTPRPSAASTAASDPQRARSAAAEGAEGVRNWEEKIWPLPANPSITAGTNRQEEGSGRLGVVEAGGLDWLEVACYGCWSLRNWQGLVAELNEKQQAAREGQAEGSWIEGPEGDRLQVQAAGAKRGEVYYSWVVLWEGVKLYLWNNPGGNDSVPSVCVSIPSVVCMDRGAFEAFEQVRQVLASLGFEMTRDIPSRCDPCVDLPGVDVGEFVSAMVEGRFIARAKKRAAYWDGEPFEGMAVGKETHLRIYDKFAESAGDPVKRALLVSRRWGHVPDKAARVEFQLRREVLRERFNVHSVADLRQKLPLILEWLTDDWFRFTETVVDKANRNHGRAEMAAMWRRVRAFFAEWCGELRVSLARPRKQIKAKAPQLVRQAVGALASAMAVEKIAADTFERFAAEVYKLVVRYADDAVDVVERKRLDHKAAGRAGPVIDELAIPF